MKKILYISLTGMSEALGRSQVLEYLIDLSKDNQIYLLSFERKQDLIHLDEIQEITTLYKINWQYFIYSNKYGVLSTIIQITKAFYYGSSCIKQHQIEIIHARSMIPATMGLLLKKIYPVKLLFDIRGFAIDEKVDSGRLKKNSLFFKLLKKIDNLIYKQSDHIVTLTHKAKEILSKSLSTPEGKITVIPTCANNKIFKSISNLEKKAFKASLNYQEQDKIIIHTGTVSGWYDFNAEVLLIKKLMLLDEKIKFLILNKHEHSYIQESFSKYQLPKEKVFITSSSFEDVYKYLNIADISIFFIKPSYSKQASAPTKFAENIACYLPSITNNNVGDMEFYMKKYDVGYLLNLEDLESNINNIAKEVLNYLNQNSQKNTEDYNSLFNLYFDKKIAIQKYQIIYQSLGS